MTNKIPPTVRESMTESPVTVGPQVSMAEAHALMREHRIRHLPVMQGGRLIGMVTARDLAVVEALADFDPRELSVDEAMSEDVYAVPPDALLRKVAAEMAERKLGSAVVVDGGKVVGVFTATDACRTLAMALAVK
jgi:acetoin utilization protein AcuB